jgi:hypothetical protein
MRLPQIIARTYSVFRLLAIITLFALLTSGARAGTLQLTCNPSKLQFGKTVLGQLETLPVTMTNSGSTDVTVSEVSVDSSAFSVDGLSLPMTLGADQSFEFQITFTPSALGTATANVILSSDASNKKLDLAVRGTGVSGWSVYANPSSLSFGNVQVGNSLSLPMALTNSGSSPVSITRAQIMGTGFSVTGEHLPLTLEAGQSFTFSVTFAPRSGGASNGSILVSNNSSPTLTIPLGGTGSVGGQLIVSPTTLSFGNVTVGGSQTQTGMLTASGASVTIYSASSNSPEFTFGGLSLPVTINAGQNVAFGVAFTPQSTGIASGTLSFTSNAGNSPAVEALNGTGIPPQQFSVDLSWNPSNSQVSGYNVYRGGVSGGPYSKINPVLDPNTAYTDNTVAHGATYYYVSTAVNSAGEESPYSNQTVAIIP